MRKESCIKIKPRLKKELNLLIKHANFYKMIYAI